VDVGGESWHGDLRGLLLEDRKPQLALKRYFCSISASRSGERAPGWRAAGAALVSAMRPAVRASTAGTAARIWRT
jgi:hypothetical protein